MAKSYTDIDQSRKLAEILPIESADQIWERIAIVGANLDVPEEMQYRHNGDISFVLSSRDGVPCWSLVALFNILPLKIEDVYSSYELKIDMVDKMPRYVLYGDCYHDSFPWDFEKEDLLDNVVESIVWLHNNNYLPKMKSYTDLEQSRKLAEFLPIESADMCYRIVAYNPNDTHEYQPYCFVSTLESDIPCWSLTALLEIMPKLYDEDDINDGGCQPVLCKAFDNNMWHVIYRSTMYGTDWYCDAIDAAFDMVCWLLKNKKIQ